MTLNILCIITCELERIFLSVIFKKILSVVVTTSIVAKKSQCSHSFIIVSKINIELHNW